VRETTLHYLVLLLQRTPSKDSRHLEALKELREMSDTLLEYKTPEVRFPIVPVLTMSICKEPLA
jgi:hypothetical protein